MLCGARLKDGEIRIFFRVQECIPVRCVPPLFTVPGGWGGLPDRDPLAPWTETPPCGQTEACKKILPYPKLRLRAVKIWSNRSFRFSM